jgi:hypothetical protein
MLFLVVTMVELQTVSVMIAALSVVVGVTYYIFNLRMTLETRQAQLFMQLYSIYESKDFMKDYTDIWRYEYTDINDWMQKYHPLKNPEAYASFMRIGRFYEGVGILVEKKLIPMELVVQLMREAILFNWDRLKVYAYGQREVTNLPIWAHFEKLAQEIKSMQPEAATSEDVAKATKSMGDIK